MNLNEIKETVKIKQSSRIQDIERYLYNIHTITSGRSMKKSGWISVLNNVKNIMKEIEEADQDVNEYWRVLDTLDWFDE